MLDAAPCQVGDVQQAVDAAQVDERAVVGDVLDDALDHRAFLQGLEQLLALLALRRFEHRAARHHDVVALAVELDDLEFELLAFVRRGVLDRTHIDQRARQEGADAVDHDGQAALDLAGDQPLHQRALFQRLFQRRATRPGAWPFARQPGFAVAVFQRLDRDRDEIAGLALRPSPRSFLNSSMEMKLSDFSPALTTTKFWSTRTTSAVITSPARISWRDRLSSNSAAKLSCGIDAGAGGGGWVAVVIIGERYSSINQRHSAGVSSSKKPLHQAVGVDSRPSAGHIWIEQHRFCYALPVRADHAAI